MSLAAASIVDPRTSFCVMLHDVAPCFEAEVDEFARVLGPLVGPAMSAAVVPCWGGKPLDDADRPFLERVARDYGNIQLHGCEHFRPKGRGLVSLFASGKDEMNGLDVAETDRRLELGQSLLTRYFGRPATGFIAPTYQVGLATPGCLARHGMHYTVGYRGITCSSGEATPIATWIWDVSPIKLLCRAGYRLGELQHRFRPGVLPCVTLHPLDLQRRFLPQITRTVEKLLLEGRTPRLLESHGYGQAPAAPADESSVPPRTPPRAN